MHKIQPLLNLPFIGAKQRRINEQIVKFEFIWEIKVNVVVLPPQIGGRGTACGG